MYIFIAANIIKFDYVLNLMYSPKYGVLVLINIDLHTETNASFHYFKDTTLYTVSNMI